MFGARRKISATSCADERHARLAADEDDFVEFASGVSFASASARRQCARVRSTMGRAMRSSSARVSDRPRLCAPVGERQGNLDGLLVRKTDASPRSTSVAHLPIRQSAQSRNPQIDERGVDVVAAEARVAVRREHLEDALVQFEDRDVERAAAEIVDGDLRAVAQPVETVGERGGGGFVDDALDGETRRVRRRALSRCAGRR